MNLFTVSYAYNGAPPASSDIVLVADTSGSMEQSDGERYLTDALKLGVDLAPENSRVAILSVSTGNISESDFADVSVVENRESIKAYIDDVTYIPLN